MKYVPPSVPLSVGGALDEWLHLFRASFRRSWALPLIMVPVIACFQYFVMSTEGVHPSAGAPWQQALTAFAATFESPKLEGSRLLLIVVIMALRGLVMAQQVAVVCGDEATAFRGALRAGLRRLPRLLLALLLLLLIFAALFGTLVADVGALGRLADGSASVPTSAIGYAIAAGIIAIGLLILAVYLWVRFGVSFAAIFVDDYRAAASLGRSWRLVEAHWWRVAIIVFVATILIWILALACASIVHVLIVDVLMRGHAAARNVAVVVTSIGNVLTMPLATAVELSIYLDLRLRREGADLAARVAALS